MCDACEIISYNFLEMYRYNLTFRSSLYNSQYIHMSGIFRSVRKIPDMCVRLLSLQLP